MEEEQPMLKRTDKVQYLKGVGEKRAAQLSKLGIVTVEDLLRSYPRDYIDYSNPCGVLEAPYETPCVVRATVFSRQAPVRVRGGRTIYRVNAGDDSAGLTLTFSTAPMPRRSWNPIGNICFTDGSAAGLDGGR